VRSCCWARGGREHGQSAPVAGLRVTDTADGQRALRTAQAHPGADRVLEAEGRLQERQAAEHEARDRVHSDRVPQGQDLAEADQAQ